MHEDDQANSESNSQSERQLVEQAANEPWIISDRLGQGHHVCNPIDHLAFTFSLDSYLGVKASRLVAGQKFFSLEAGDAIIL